MNGGNYFSEREEDRGRGREIEGYPESSVVRRGSASLGPAARCVGNAGLTLPSHSLLLLHSSVHLRGKPGALLQVSRGVRGKGGGWTWNIQRAVSPHVWASGNMDVGCIDRSSG